MYEIPEVGAEGDAECAAGIGGEGGPGGAGGQHQQEVCLHSQVRAYVKC